jgi:hypothetical protein
MTAAGVGPPTLTAVTVTAVVEVTDGAWNKPAPDMLPFVADHSTAVLPVPLRVAVSWRLDPDCTSALPGSMRTVTAGEAG